MGGCRRGAGWVGVCLCLGWGVCAWGKGGRAGVEGKASRPAPMANNNSARHTLQRAPFRHKRCRLRRHGRDSGHVCCKGRSSRNRKRASLLVARYNLAAGGVGKGGGGSGGSVGSRPMLIQCGVLLLQRRVGGGGRGEGGADPATSSGSARQKRFPTAGAAAGRRKTAEGAAAGRRRTAAWAAAGRRRTASGRLQTVHRVKEYHGDSQIAGQTLFPWSAPAHRKQTPAHQSTNLRSTKPRQVLP